MSDIKKYAALVREMQRRAAKDPCWDGYEMAGTKKKNGKTVPNCVPKKKAESDMENIESKKADALNRFLSKYAKQPFDVFPNAHETAEDPSEVDDVEFNKKADNRAMDLDRQIKDSNKSKSGKKYFEPAGTQNQPRDKGVKMPKGKNLGKAKPDFKSASVTEALFNIYQEADFEGDTDPGKVQPPKLPSPKLPPVSQNKPPTYNDDMKPPTSPTYDDKMSERMRQNPPKYDGDSVAHNDKLYLYNEWMRSQKPNGDKPTGPYDDKMSERMRQNPPKYNGDMVAYNDDLYLYNKWMRSQNKPPTHNGNTPNSEFINRDLISNNSITNQLFNIYQEAYGVSGPSGSGGSYGMGQGIDMSSKTRINNPMDRPRTPEDSASPLGDIPTYEMKDTRKGPMDPYKLPGGAATKGMTMNDRKQKDLQPINDARKIQRDKDMAMIMQQFEPQQKQPGKLRQFVDWLKGIHQQTFGGGQMSPDELAEMRVRQNPIQASQIQKFVKTAVADDNSFRIILAAMNEMGYTSGDILAAFK